MANTTDDTMTDRAELREAEAMVLSNPAIMGGEPCIAGTRVPVYMIGNLTAEVGIDEALDTYPFLGRRRIELALAYVTAYPGVYAPDLSHLDKLKKKGPARRVTMKRIDI